MIRLVVVFVIASLGVAEAGDRAKAEALFRAGEQAFRAQNFAAAAESFELAYKELELPEIAFSAAQSYRRQFFIDNKPDQVKRAIQLYRIYLDKVKTGGRVADASDGLAEMQRELDKIAPTERPAEPVAAAPPATRLLVNAIVEGQDRTSMIELSVLPSADKLGAVATLDGKSLRLADPVDVTPGDHTVEVSAPGYFAITVRKRVPVGKTELVEAVLRPKPATIAVATEPDARIEIDGRAVIGGSQEVAAGTHVVSIAKRGREPVVRELTVARGERRIVDLALAPTRQRRAVKWVAISGGAVALAGVVAAGIAVRADGKMSDLANKRATIGLTADELTDYQHYTDQRDRLRGTAFLLGGAALAAGGAAFALYWFDTPSPRRMIVPTGGETRGVSLLGRF